MLQDSTAVDLSLSEPSSVGTTVQSKNKGHRIHVPARKDNDKSAYISATSFSGTVRKKRDIQGEGILKSTKSTVFSRKAPPGCDSLIRFSGT